MRIEEEETPDYERELDPAFIASIHSSSTGVTVPMNDKGLFRQASGCEGDEDIDDESDDHDDDEVWSAELGYL